MSTQCKPIWKGGINLGWDHNGAPVQMSQPLTTRQMNINPCTSMGLCCDPGTDGYNRMDVTATAGVPPASISTPYFPTSTVGPMELAHYGGRIPALSPPPSEDHGGLRRVHQQQMRKPHVTAMHNLPPLVNSYSQHSRSQKGQSRREVCERSKSAQKNYKLNGSMAGGEDDGPDSQCGRRHQEFQTGGRTSALETALAVLKQHQPLDSFGQSERSPSVPPVSTSSTSQSVSTHSQDPSVGKEHCSYKLPSHTPCPAAHPAHLKRQAMSKNKRFTDAHIHDFIMERVERLRKGAGQTHCLSSSNLNVCLPSKQNTGTLSLKMAESAPRQVTSTALSEEVCLSSSGSAGIPALDCNGNEKWSTAFGKGIPEKHAELSHVLQQDGQAKPKPEKDSTEYPKIMRLAADVCAKNDDEYPVILSAFSGTTLKECRQQAAAEIRDSATQERYTSSWLIANSLEDLHKEPGSLHPDLYVGHPEAREMGTMRLADNWQAGKLNTEMYTANSIQMTGKEEPWFKSQRYEDISDDDSKNEPCKDLDLDLQSNRLPSETTMGNLSPASSKYCPVYEDISDMENSTNEFSIIDEPLVTQLSNNVKQPTESGSPTNVLALSKHLFNSAQHPCDGISNGEETLWSTEKELCISIGKNSWNNKGPDLIPGLLPEVHAPRSLQQQVIYISSDEDPMDLSTEEDGSTDTETQEIGTEAISPMVEEEDAEEDWLMIPVAIPYLAFVDADVSQAKTKSSGKNILPSITKELLPTSPMRPLEVFDTIDIFLRTACPNPCSDADSQTIIVSDDELFVPTPTEGNLIPAEPSNGNIVPRCRKRSSSCDTEDSSDYSSSESSGNYLTVSAQCWEYGNPSKSLKKKRRCEKLHSAKPQINTLSDSTDEVEMEASLETDVPMTPEPKSTPIESDDEDDEISVEFKKAPTKCNAKTEPTAKKGLKKLTTDGANLKHGGAKGLSSSESEDLGDHFPVLQSGHLIEGHRNPVKGPQKRTSFDSEIVQKPPCLAGAEEPVSTSRRLREPNLIIPHLMGQMPFEESEPVTLKQELTIPKNKRDDSRLSRGIKKNNLVTSANGNPRNKTREEKLRSDKLKMLDGPNGEHKVNAFNTGHNLTSSKPTSVSKDHLITPKQLTSTAALQKNKGHSTASTESSRTSSSSDKEPTRTASSGGTTPSRTASSGGTTPSRTASSGGTEPSRSASSSGTEPSRATSSGGKEPPRTASSSGTTPYRTASSGGPAPSRTAFSSCIPPSRTAFSGGTARSRTVFSSCIPPSRTAFSGGTAPSRTASSGVTAPSRTASSGVTAPSRTASSGDHNNLSPLETSPSSPFFSCNATSSKKRISHYCRSTDKMKDSIHQKLSLLTQTAPSSSRGQSNLVISQSSEPRKHSIDSKRVTISDTSGSTKESAKQQINKDWKDSYVSTKIARRHSSGPEDTRRRASSSKNAAMSEQQDAGKDAELEPCPNAAQQKNATPLMKRTKNQAKRLTQDIHLRGSSQEQRHSVGEGYKWFQNQKSMNHSRKRRPSSPSEVEQLSQW